VAPREHTTLPVRARAVADLPLDALLARADELTRRWAIALIQARPAGSLGSVPLSELGDEGPALCRALLAALGSEDGLARLLSGAGEGPSGSPAALLRELAGSHEPSVLVDVVEALRGAAWELLGEAVANTSLPGAARRLSDVGDRLAFVCSRLLAHVLDSARAPEAGVQTAERQEHSPGVIGARALSLTAPTGPITILDERAGAVEQDAVAAEGAEGEPPGRSGPLSERLRAVGQGERSFAGEADEIEIRDERREEGPGAWIGSIGRQLQQYAEDRRPFAVLLVELLDVERHRDDQRDPQALASLLARVERLLGDELALGSGGWLTRERPGRYWLMSPQTDRLGALRLAERLRAAVASGGARLGGSAAAIVIGSAVCPDDGERAPALAAHADVGLYAARAEARAAPLRGPGAESGA
jgi:GGDEF domain-containing protein